MIGVREPLYMTFSAAARSVLATGTHGGGVGQVGRPSERHLLREINHTLVPAIPAIPTSDAECRRCLTAFGGGFHI